MGGLKQLFMSVWNWKVVVLKEKKKKAALKPTATKQEAVGLGDLHV